MFIKNGRSAIWGGGTLGLVIGVVLVIFYKDSSLIFKAILVGVIVGIIAEILGKIGDRVKRQ